MTPHPKVVELIDLLNTQAADLQKASGLIDNAEQAVIELKQIVSQANEALQNAEAEISQRVCADVNLKNESARANANRTERSKDLNWVQLMEQFRDKSHKLACEQQNVKQLIQRRTDLELHGRNLRAAAELLAAQLHEQAQAKRQAASRDFLQGAAR